jgi:hypothetical protein
MAMGNADFQRKVADARQAVWCALRAGMVSGQEVADPKKDLLVMVDMLRGGAIHRATSMWNAIDICVGLLLGVLRVKARHGYPGRAHVDRMADHLLAVCELLERKNASYGNTALEPVGIFARGSAMELIDVRIDDKLSRLLSQGEDFGEDTLTDLAGYLLLRIIVLQTGGFVAPAGVS